MALRLARALYAISGGIFLFTIMHDHNGRKAS